MNIDDMTIGEAKQLAAMVAPDLCHTTKATSLKVGNKYFIRTVTHYILGELAEITDETFVMARACWIADTGRFADFLKTGTPSEAEPFGGNAHVMRHSIVDVADWAHALVEEQT